MHFSNLAGIVVALSLIGQAHPYALNDEATKVSSGQRMLRGVQSNTAYITYHNYNSEDSTNSVACSDGPNGLKTRWNYDTLHPMFPYIAAVSNLSWNSPNCGVCYKLTSGRNTVHITAIDQCGFGPTGEAHFDMAPDAFMELLGDDGHQHGHGPATFQEVDNSFCEGNLGSFGSTSETYSESGMCGGGNRGDGVCEDTSLCCSQWGWCGNIREHCDHTLDVDYNPASEKGTCGGGYRGNGFCTDGSCCSKWGWCGTTISHCDD